jgi:hypothetical protein
LRSPLAASNDLGRTIMGKPSASGTETSSALDREFLIKLVAPVLAIATAVLFGMLTIEYDQFYRELGMAPGDVGVEYGTQLGGAVGLVLIVTLITVVLLLLWKGLLVMLRRPVWMLGQDRTALQRAVLAGIAVATVAVSGFVVHQADRAADQAKAGQWVQPLGWGPLMYLGVRAYPARVSLVTSGDGKRLNLDGVNRDRLMYIGHGQATVVLYDADQQRPVYLPTSQVIVIAYNCETERTTAHECANR